RSSYGRSKLANLLFAFELQRRSGGSGLLSVAVHPGVIATNFIKVGPLKPLLRLVMKSPAQGAVPTLYAAGSPEIRGGEFVGPGITPQKTSGAARSEELAERLWEVSTELTGVRFEEITHR